MKFFVIACLALCFMLGVILAVFLIHLIISDRRNRK